MAALLGLISGCAVIPADVEPRKSKPSSRVTTRVLSSLNDRPLALCAALDDRARSQQELRADAAHNDHNQRRYADLFTTTSHRAKNSRHGRHNQRVGLMMLAPTSAQASAATRSRGRDVARRGAIARHSAPAPTRRPRDHLGVPPRNRQHRDRSRRPRTPGAHDPGHPRPVVLLSTWWVVLARPTRTGTSPLQLSPTPSRGSDCRQGARARRRPEAAKAFVGTTV